MRITNRMLCNNVLKNINRNLENMSRRQEQMSSGKSVNRPSDGPITVARILAFQTSLAADQQYRTNMEDAQGWVDTSERALDMATATLHRAKDLAVTGANSTQPQASMEAMAEEVGQLLEELLQVANTSYGGRFLFGGSNTTSEPFSLNDGVVSYQGNENSLDWEIAPRVTMGVNAHGKEVFLDALDTDADGVADMSIFELLQELKEALANGDHQAVGETLNRFEPAIDHLLAFRAVLGAKSNRLEMAISRLEDSQTNLTKTMSLLEDIDLAEIVMYYKSLANVYQASLATGTMVLQPSLIDYLR